MPVWHNSHTHRTELERDQCEAKLLRENRAFAIKFALVMIAIAAVLATFSCLYALATYGDWTCGLPLVECRKMIAP